MFVTRTSSGRFGTAQLTCKREWPANLLREPAVARHPVSAANVLPARRIILEARQGRLVRPLACMYAQQNTIPVSGRSHAPYLPGHAPPRQVHMRTDGQLQAVLIGKDPKTLALAERALNAFHFQTQIFRQAQQALEFLKSHAADLIMAEAEEQVHTFPQVVREMARRQVLISIAPSSASM